MNRTKIGGIIQNAHLSALCILGIADRPGIAATVLNALGQEHISLQFIAQLIDFNHQDHLCLCIDRSELSRARPLAEAAARSVGAQTVQDVEEASLISIFGPDFRERPGIAGAMSAALAAKGINILAISTSISTVSCVIETKNLASAIEALQETFELP
jgi:aspartate kinase